MTVERPLRVVLSSNPARPECGLLLSERWLLRSSPPLCVRLNLTEVRRESVTRLDSHVSSPFE
eukprot:6377556-Prymnesium_polylepis.1